MKENFQIYWGSQWQSEDKSVDIIVRRDGSIKVNALDEYEPHEIGARSLHYMADKQLAILDGPARQTYSIHHENNELTIIKLKNPGVYGLSDSWEYTKKLIKVS